MCGDSVGRHVYSRAAHRRCVVQFWGLSMNVVSNALRVTATAFALTVGLASAAMADDFIKECKIGNPGPTADKVCGCMSDKVTGSDRSDVIEAMSKTNVAMAKGAAADPATMTPKVMKGIETAMTVQAQCM